MSIARKILAVLRFPTDKIRASVAKKAHRFRILSSFLQASAKPAKSARERNKQYSILSKIKSWRLIYVLKGRS
ncbi:MAG TPA: hypothetical protein DIT10_06030 [Chryseobacterium sp.]|nr:hypothetical protein [Chryseobacterium sp.]